MMANPVHIGNSDIVNIPGYGNPAKTIAWPSGIQSGDLVVLVGVIENGSYTPAITGGFTLLQRNGANGFVSELYVAYKLYRTGDTAPTVHPGATYNSRWRNVAIRGVDQTTPIEASRQSRSTESDSTINIPTSTVTVADALHLVIVAQLDLGANTVLTANAPLSLLAESDTSAYGFIVAAANGPSSAGTVTAKTVSSTRTNNHGSVDFLVRPAAGGGGTEPPPGSKPSGTFAIGVVTKTQTTASVPYTYLASDQTMIQYRLNGGNAETATASPQQLTGLVAGTGYEIEFRAVNSNGSGDWSTAEQFTTQSVPVGRFTTGVLMREVGRDILANTALTYFRLYDIVTGALVLERNDLSTNASGIVSFTDPAITAGVQYRADWLAVTGECCMPSAEAA